MRDSFCTQGGPLDSAPGLWCPTPNMSHPEVPGRTHPKMFDPKFLENVRGRGQNVDLVIRGPSTSVRDKILETVPWPLFP